MDLSKVSVLVTGAAGGLGSATARHFGSRAASMVLFDRDRPGTEALASELGDRAVGVGGDVTNDDDVGAALDAALDLSPLRVVTNVAGGGMTSQRLVGKDGSPHDREAFEYTMVMNAFGTSNDGGNSLRRGPDYTSFVRHPRLDPRGPT